MQRLRDFTAASSRQSNTAFPQTATRCYNSLHRVCDKPVAANGRTKLIRDAQLLRNCSSGNAVPVLNQNCVFLRNRFIASSVSQWFVLRVILAWAVSSLQFVVVLRKSWDRHNHICRFAWICMSVQLPTSGLMARICVNVYVTWALSPQISGHNAYNCALLLLLIWICMNMYVA